jgi:hypothetical protein
MKVPEASIKSTAPRGLWKAIELFEREASELPQLHHPGIGSFPHSHWQTASVNHGRFNVA